MDLILRVLIKKSTRFALEDSSSYYVTNAEHFIIVFTHMDADIYVVCLEQGADRNTTIFIG